jgi:hypothetical protein
MRTKFYTLICITLAVFQTSVKGQSIANYTFSSSVGTYTPLSNPTVPTLSGGDLDEGYYNNIPVGFEFWYYGNLVTTVHATTNGLLSVGSTFVPTGAAANNNLAGAISGIARPILAPLWDNLDMDSLSGAEFSYATIGTAPNRVFVAQWKNAEWNWFANDATISFQVKLYEGSGIVEYVYNQESGTLFSPSASIGITGAINTVYLSLNNSSNSPTVSSTTSYNSLNAKPASGQTYTFTPPVPGNPSGLTITNINPTNLTVNWTSVPGALKYVVYRSMDNVNFTYAGSASSTSLLVTGLFPNTLYYFRVYSISEGALCNTPATGSSTTQSGAVYGTISVPGNAPTITSVLDSIKLYGIGGPVIIELNNGYNSSLERFPIYLSDSLGTSSNAPLTIRPASSATGIEITTPSTFGYCLYLWNSKYITIDGRPGGVGTTSELTLRNNYYASVMLYAYSGSSSNNLITYTKFKAASGASNVYSFIDMNQYYTSLVTNNEISYNELGDSNVMSNYGIRLYNYNSTVSNGTVINGNRIFNIGGASIIGYGIYSYGTSNHSVSISNNHIYNITPSSTSYANFAFYGIFAQGGSYNINGNSIGGSDVNCGGSAFEIGPASSSNSFYGIYFSGSANHVLSAQGNKIANFFWPGTNTNPWTGIYVNSGTAFIGDTIGNIIGDPTSSSPSVYVLSQTSTTTPTAYGIRSISSSPVRIKNNTISALTGVGVNSSYPCSVVGISSSGSSNLEIMNNTIGSLTNTNAFRAASPSSSYPQAAVGVQVIANGIGTVKVSDNTVANLVNSGLSTSLQNYACGMSITSNATTTITNNTITKVFAASGNPAANGLSALSGIYFNTTSGAGALVNNKVHTLRSTATTAPALVQGINVTSTSGSTIQLDANFVHSLSSASSSISGGIMGINLQDGILSATNNMVRLGIDQNGSGLSSSIAYTGINKVTGYSAFVYNNSVYIGGTVTGTNLVNTYAFRRVNDGVDEVKNNIFTNARTNTTTGGKHVAMGVNSVNNYSSNNNLFFAPGTGGRLFLNGSTEYTTRTLWYTATGLDDNSDSSSVPFINATGDATTVDLHLAINTPTKAEANGATSIVTTDYDGQTRSSLTPNDIGADAGNFIQVGITPAPVIWMWVKGEKHVYDAEVKWMVALESNNNYFIVERSFDGEHYEEIGKVKGAGTRNVRTLYAYTDKGIFTDYKEVVYYRIAQYDYDGRYSYSSVVALYTGNQEVESAVIYPNPTRTETRIALPPSTSSKQVTVTITTPTGNVCSTKQYTYDTELKLNTEALTQGIYFVSIKVDDKKELVKKLTIE